MDLMSSFAGAYNHISDAVIIMGVEEGPVFRYLMANDAAQRLTGISLADIGKTLTEVREGSYASILTHYFTEAALTKKTVEFDDIPQGLHARRSHVIATPILDNDKCTRIFVVAKTPAHEIGIVRHLAFIEGRYESLLAHNPDMIFYSDIHGVIRDVNPAVEAILGYRPRDIVGQRLLNFVPQELRSQHLIRFLEVFNQQSEVFQTYSLSKSGQRVDLSVSFLPHEVGGKVIGVFGIAKDISETRRLQEQIEASEWRYRLITEHMTDLVCLMDPTGVVQYASPSYQWVLGVEPAWYQGKQGRVIVHPDDLNVVLEQFSIAVSTKKPTNVEYRKENPQLRSYIHVQTTLIPVVEKSDEVTYVIAVSHNISEQVAYEKKLHSLAYTDPLTGLPNRRMFLKIVADLIGQNQVPCTPSAVLFIDCDNFKDINDSFGHDVGDRALMEIAGRIRSCVRTNDLVCRLAGDEFAIFLGQAVEEEAVEVAQRLSRAFDSRWMVDKREISLQLSIGIALYPAHGTSVDMLIKKADQAMYEAKTQGKGRYFLASRVYLEK